MQQMFCHYPIQCESGTDRSLSQDVHVLGYPDHVLYDSPLLSLILAVLSGVLTHAYGPFCCF